MSKSAEEMRQEAALKHIDKFFERLGEAADEATQHEPTLGMEVTVYVFVECDACGHREQVVNETAAKQAVRDHVQHCRRTHKGVVR